MLFLIPDQTCALISEHKVQGLTQQTAGQGRKLPVCPAMRIPSGTVPRPGDRLTPVQRNQPFNFLLQLDTIWSCQSNTIAFFQQKQRTCTYKCSSHMREGSMHNPHTMVGYLGLNEGLDLEQLICSLLNDAQVLENGGLCDPSMAS